MDQTAETWDNLWDQARDVLRAHAPTVSELSELSAHAAGLAEEPELFWAAFKSFWSAWDQLRGAMATALVPTGGTGDLYSRLYDSAPADRSADMLELLRQTHLPFASQISVEQVRSGEAAAHLAAAAQAWADGKLLVPED